MLAVDEGCEECALEELNEQDGEEWLEEQEGNKDIKKPKSMQQGSPDNFQTPKEALYPLLPYLKKDWVIWECAEGEGNLSKYLFDKGFSVIGSDVLSEEYQVPYTRMFGKNFLHWEPKHFDCIITNPPFSLKQEFLERCYKLKKPFALLLPLTTFETPNRQKLFQRYGLQVLFFDKRIKFKTPTGREGNKSSPWFATAWFTFGLNLPKDMNFIRYEHPDQTKLF